MISPVNISNRPARPRFVLVVVLGLLVCASASASDRRDSRPVKTETGKSRPGSAQPTRLPLELQQVEAASSSQKIRDQICQDLPLDRLEDHHRAQVEALLGGPTLFRRLPAIRIELDPRSYEYFRRRPEMATAIWRVLGISQLTLNRTAPNMYTARNTDGSQGMLEILLRSKDLMIARGTGTWNSGLLAGRIRGEGLVVLRHRYERDQQGRQYVTHQAALFLSFPRQSIRTIARLIAPLTNIVADRNFYDISAFLRMMHLAAVGQPGWIESIANRLEDVSAADREAFLKTAARAHVADRRRREGEVQR